MEVNSVSWAGSVAEENRSLAIRVEYIDDMICRFRKVNSDTVNLLQYIRAQPQVISEHVEKGPQIKVLTRGWKRSLFRSSLFLIALYANNLRTDSVIR